VLNPGQWGAGAADNWDATASYSEVLGDSPAYALRDLRSPEHAWPRVPRADEWSTPAGAAAEAADASASTMSTEVSDRKDESNKGDVFDRLYRQAKIISQRREQARTAQAESEEVPPTVQGDGLAAGVRLYEEGMALLSRRQKQVDEAGRCEEDKFVHVHAAKRGVVDSTQACERLYAHAAALEEKRKKAAEGGDEQRSRSLSPGSTARVHAGERLFDEAKMRLTRQEMREQQQDTVVHNHPQRPPDPEVFTKLHDEHERRLDRLKQQAQEALKAEQEQDALRAMESVHAAARRASPERVAAISDRLHADAILQKRRIAEARKAYAREVSPSRRVAPPDWAGPPPGVRLYESARAQLEKKETLRQNAWKEEKESFAQHSVHAKASADGDRFSHLYNDGTRRAQALEQARLAEEQAQAEALRAASLHKSRKVDSERFQLLYEDSTSRAAHLAARVKQKELAEQKALEKQRAAFAKRNKSRSPERAVKSSPARAAPKQRELSPKKPAVAPSAIPKRAAAKSRSLKTHAASTSKLPQARSEASAKRASTPQPELQPLPSSGDAGDDGPTKDTPDVIRDIGSHERHEESGKPAVSRSSASVHRSASESSTQRRVSFSEAALAVEPQKWDKGKDLLAACAGELLASVGSHILPAQAALVREILGALEQPETAGTESPPTEVEPRPQRSAAKLTTTVPKGTGELGRSASNPELKASRPAKSALKSSVSSSQSAAGSRAEGVGKVLRSTDWVPNKRPDVVKPQPRANSAGRQPQKAAKRRGDAVQVEKRHAATPWPQKQVETTSSGVRAMAEQVHMAQELIRGMESLSALRQPLVAKRSGRSGSDRRGEQARAASPVKTQARDQSPSRIGGLGSRSPSPGGRSQPAQAHMAGGGSARQARSVSPGLPQQQPKPTQAARTPSPARPPAVSSGDRGAICTPPAVADTGRQVGRPRTPSPARVSPGIFATPSPPVQRSPASAEDVLGPIDRAMQAIDQRLKAHEARKDGGRTATSPVPLRAGVDQSESEHRGVEHGCRQMQADLVVPTVASSFPPPAKDLQEPKKVKKALAWDPGPPVAIEGKALWGDPPQQSFPRKAEEAEDEEERNALAALERRCSTRVSVVLTGGQLTPPRGSLSSGEVGSLKALPPSVAPQTSMSVAKPQIVAASPVVPAPAPAVQECSQNVQHARERKLASQQWPSHLPFSNSRDGSSCTWAATPVPAPVEHPPFRPEVRQGASAFARALRQSELAVKQALEAAKAEERQASDANRKLLEENSAVLALESPTPQPRTPPSPTFHGGLMPAPPSEAAAGVVFRAPQSDASQLAVEGAPVAQDQGVAASPEVQIASFALSMVYGKVKDL